MQKAKVIFCGTEKKICQDTQKERKRERESEKYTPYTPDIPIPDVMLKCVD